MAESEIMKILLGEQEKGQIDDKARAVKQKIHREHSKNDWFMIRRVTQDPKSPSVVKVEQFENGRKVETCMYSGGM